MLVFSDSSVFSQTNRIDDYSLQHIPRTREMKRLYLLIADL